MERGEKDSRLLKNQPYDESLEVVDSEESVYSPTPGKQVTSAGLQRSHTPGKELQQPFSVCVFTEIML